MFWGLTPMLLFVGAEVGGIYVSLHLEAGVGRYFKGITGPVAGPTIATRELNGQRAADNGHHFFFTGAELVLTGTDHTYGCRQRLALKGDRLHFTVEVFVY